EAAKFGRLPMRWLVDRRLIVDVNERSALEQLPVGVLRSGFVPLAYYFVERRGQAAGRHCAYARTVPKLQGSTGDPAKTVRLFQHRVEHGREDAKGGVDDAEHLSGCGLLLQGFACFGDQPRVLHRNDRLRGEVLQEGNLLVSEWADFLPIDREEAHGTIVSLQVDPYRTARSAQIDHRIEDW